MNRKLTVLQTIAFFVVAWLAAVLFLQRGMMYPRPSGPAPRSAGGAERVALGESYGLYLAPVPAPAPGSPAPLLIYFHGNAELAADWADQFGEPRGWGWAVLLVEYPGYGGAGGRPSEASITAVALAAYDWARADGRVDGARIVPFGRSLGGGAAARIASARLVAALVLESAFTSVRPLARRFLVPGFLVKDPFDNLAALAGWRGHLLVLHGQSDPVIPFAHGRALAGAVPGAVFVPMACGHNDCAREWPAIGAWFLERGLPGPRRRPAA